VFSDKIEIFKLELCRIYGKTRKVFCKPCKTFVFPLTSKFKIDKMKMI